MKTDLRGAFPAEPGDAELAEASRELDVCLRGELLSGLTLSRTVSWRLSGFLGPHYPLWFQKAVFSVVL